MVRYHIDLSEPGLPAKSFDEGFSSGIAQIRVGAEKELFEVPIAHITHIDFFAKALNGPFSEGSSKSIMMPEDDSKAFGWILRWSYRGLQWKDLTAPSLQDCRTCVNMLLMADKWLLKDLTLNLAKHLINVLRGSRFPAKPDVCENDSTWRIIRLGLKLTEHTAYRYIFVHAVWQEPKTLWFYKVKYITDEMPQFPLEMFKWSSILSEVQKTTPYAWTEKDACALESKAHAVDKILLPLLFEDLEFPSELFRTLGDACPEPDKRREFLRKHLDM